MRDTTRTDLFLAALLSLFTHYAIVSAIPKAKPARAPSRYSTVELELATPTAAERAAPMPAISLPTAATAPLPTEEVLAQAVPEPTSPAATAAPTPPQEQAEPAREHPEVPDDFLQAVDLPNPNPDEPTPDDPHYLAQTNMDTEEESVARARSTTGEAAELAPEPSGRSPGESEEPGDAEEEVVAQEDDHPGADVPAEAIAASSGTNQPPTEGSAAEARQEVASVEAVPDTSLGATGELGVSAETGREGTVGQEGQEGRTGRPGKLNLKISWNQFREMYGEGELARQREEIAAERRRSSTKGHYRRNWERVRASMENYVPHVRPGNQTALRTAQSPFAAYLAHVHQRIHRYWADGFLVDLLALGDQNALNDPNLRTDLEIVIAPDGQVAEVGVVRTSGLVAFDAAAIDSAYRSGPHPSPPDAIKSGDGRVYFHWGFYRNARQCGTFNATPFLLPDPPNLPRDSAEQPRPGGAQPPATEPEPDHGTPSEPTEPTHREVADDAAAG